MRRAATVLGLFLLAGAAATAGPASAVLNGDSFWRFHVTLREPAVLGRDDAVLKVQVPYRSYPGIQYLETDAPPGDWAAADFADAQWPRGRVGEEWPDSVAHAAFTPAVQFSNSLVCLRGKFAVTDPAAVEGLSLTMKYRGGAVVYLNGQEVARKDLPGGKVDASTPGAPYPPEAYLDSSGKPLPGPYHAERRIKAGERDLADRLASRDRSLGPLALPLKALRKGVNVLAIELHRSGYHPSATLWFAEPYVGKECSWVPVGILDVRLAAQGTGATPNVARPRGLQVWNQDINDRVSVLDYGDPNEPLVPIVLAGARNGAFSGQVVLGSTEPIRGLKAEASDLVGPGTIPAAQVHVRYPVLDGHGYHWPDWFDGIAEAPPPEVPVHKSGAAVQPVWVTVRVPRDAAAGDYRGTLTLAVAGAQPLAVPIRLHVADWALPDPRDFRTYVGIYESPTSLALQYKVPEWSEEHWKLVEKSFALLGQVGNKLVNVTIVDRTQLGNDEGMVAWVRKPNGTFGYDFAVFDRYIALVKKHLGVPDFVALQVWHSGGWETRKADQENTVTVVGPDGRREHMQVPVFGTEASKLFWRPLLDAVRERLAAQGMEKALCLGILSDGTAPQEVFRAFDEIVPGGARWTRGCHSATREPAPYRASKGGGTVVCHEFCYGMAMADPTKGLPPIWRQRTWPGVAFIRHNFDDTLSLLKYRTMAERALYCGTRGIGRIGLDYWDVVKDAQGRGANIFNRWPHSSCAQRAPNLFRLAAPGPDGPLPTARFEQLREGVQDAEAMVLVAQALGEHADALGPDLAATCRSLFVDRINYCRRTCPESYGRVAFRTCHLGWLDLSARLYAAAAEVAKRLASK